MVVRLAHHRRYNERIILDLPPEEPMRVALSHQYNKKAWSAWQAYVQHAVPSETYPRNLLFAPLPCSWSPTAHLPSLHHPPCFAAYLAASISLAPLFSIDPGHPHASRRHGEHAYPWRKQPRRPPAHGCQRPLPNYQLQRRNSTRGTQLASVDYVQRQQY